jgi:FeS assembly SUF system regulator
MFKINKLTDYALAVLGILHQARTLEVPLSASAIASRLHLGVETVRKVLKMLVEPGYVASQRGAEGGYRLACDVAALSLRDFITALEGAPATTSCVLGEQHCAQHAYCGLSDAWGQVNGALLKVLDGFSVQSVLEVPSCMALCGKKESV